jgi:hypothetical protein
MIIIIVIINNNGGSSSNSSGGSGRSSSGRSVSLEIFAVIIVFMNSVKLLWHFGALL